MPGEHLWLAVSHAYCHTSLLGEINAGHTVHWEKTAGGFMPDLSWTLHCVSLPVGNFHLSSFTAINHNCKLTVWLCSESLSGEVLNLRVFLATS